MLEAYSDGTFQISSIPDSTNIEAATWRSGSENAVRATKGLLLACIYRAQSECLNRQYKSVTIANYVLAVLTNYHTTKATTEFFPRCITALEKDGRHQLAELMRRKLEQEQGHWRLALRDLEDLVDTSSLLYYVPERARLVISVLEKYSKEDDPIEVFGYSYTLEWLALLVTNESVEAARSLLKEKQMAIRCLIAHSSIGEEGKHEFELLKAISLCSKLDVKRIASGAYKTMVAMCRICADENDPEKIIGSVHQPFKVAS